jgi:hypothetical protein
MVSQVKLLPIGQIGVVRLEVPVYTIGRGKPTLGITCSVHGDSSSNTVKISVDRYTYEDRELLRHWLKTSFKIDASVQKDRIYILRSSFPTLIRIVSNHLPRFMQRQLQASENLSLKLQDLHEKEGVILIEKGARLDAQGRLYLPGMTTVSRINSVPVPGQGRLPTQDGYVIARFTRDGVFDKIVARLKIPIDVRPHQLWDFDAAGNLYYLQFSTEGVEIHRVPTT